MKFAQILKELRQEASLTQKELAQNIKVSSAIIGFWENGINEPTAAAIIAVAEFFGVTTDYLLGLDDYDPTAVHRPAPATALSDKQREIMSEIAEVDDSLTLTHILGYVRGIKDKVIKNKRGQDRA
jgi:transcriptional regulator with XRE-family HTH domain